MKANQFSHREDDAVSPVIGVILMVAITVVLAAVVFVLVSNLSEGGDQAPTVGFQKDESADRLNVISADNGIQWSDFEFSYRGTLDTDTTAYVLCYAINANSNDAAGVCVDAADGATAESGAVTTTNANIDPATALTADLAGGNFLDFCAGHATGTATQGPIDIVIVHTETNTQVYETTFNTVGVC